MRLLNINLLDRHRTIVFIIHNPLLFHRKQVSREKEVLKSKTSKNYGHNTNNIVHIIIKK